MTKPAGITGRLVSALLASTVLAAVTATAPAPTLAFGGDGLRAAINGYRAEAGLPPVAGTDLLDSIARERADQLVQQDRMEHDIDYVVDRLNHAGVCWSGVGEILAWEKGWPEYDYQRTAAAWDGSPTHHDIMLGTDYNAAGGAWADGRDMQHYSVMVFVTLCNRVSAQTSAVRQLKPTDRYDPDRGLVLQRGRHRAYRLADDGTILGRRTLWLDHQLVRSAAGRTKNRGHVWLKVSSGGLTGLWVLEGPRQWVRGTTALVLFDQPLDLTVARGAYVAQRFDWLGRVKATRQHRYYHKRHVHAGARAIINGQRYYRFTEGPLAGCWVRDTAAISPA
jgi:hypothetical protein